MTSACVPQSKIRHYEEIAKQADEHGLLALSTAASASARFEADQGARVQHCTHMVYGLDRLDVGLPAGS